MVWDCNGVGGDSVVSGIGLGGAGGVAFAEALGPAAGSVVVDFSDVGVDGGVDFGDGKVGFSFEVLGPAACSVGVDFEDLGVDFCAVRGVDVDVVGFLVEFGNVGVDILLRKSARLDCQEFVL